MHFNIPNELKEKLIGPKVEMEIEADTPNIPRGGLIIGMEMPKGEEPEKNWAYQTDWLCYNSEGDLLCVTCVSDDGKAWFLKQFINTVVKGDELKKMVTKGYHEMLQAAKSLGCDTYHYYICECKDHDKLKDNKDLEKMLPEGKVVGENNFKDYEVPLPYEDFKKQLKKYYTALFENPGTDGY